AARHGVASIAQADQVACVRATLATLVGWLCTIRRECKAGCTASAERAALAGSDSGAARALQGRDRRVDSTPPLTAQNPRENNSLGLRIGISMALKLQPRIGPYGTGLAAIREPWWGAALVRGSYQGTQGG